MVNAQSDRASYYFVQEASWGTTPSNPTMLKLRITSEDLAFEPSTTESAELDSSGEVQDLILVNQRAAGPVQGEFSYGTYDNQLANLLRTHSGSSVGWPASVTEAAGGNATIASNVVTFTGATFVSDGYAVGDWVKMSGWNTAGNNTWGKISALTETTLTLVNCTLTDQGTPETDVSIVLGGHIANGTTLGSETVVRRYEDLATTPNIPCAVFTGMTPDTFTLNIRAGAVATCTIGYVGKAESSSTDGTIKGSGSWASSPGANKTPFNCTSHVVSINVGGSSYPVRSLTLNINNGVRAREQVGTLGAASLGLGKCRVTCDFEAYYADDTEYAKFLAQSDSSAWWVMQDVDGNEYLFELPLMKWNSFTRSNPGTGQDIIAQSSGTCIADATANGGKTIRITKWAAA